MTNHYWDRVSAPHADRDRSEPADRDADNAPSACEVCGHALSRHNSLGYCRNESKRAGQCPCDMTRRGPEPTEGGAP